jgi:hypothetical protein|tara:strand:- start:255 stop:557 length:303 start_codon:yes stop_codon:yes gene_type:complete
MLESENVKDIPENVPTENTSNGTLTKDIYFSLAQANLAKNLLQAVNESRNVYVEAQSRWEAFLVGIGMCPGDEIVGGDLDSNESNKRCLTISTSNGIAKE